MIKQLNFNMENNNISTKNVSYNSNKVVGHIVSYSDFKMDDLDDLLPVPGSRYNNLKSHRITTHTSYLLINNYSTLSIIYTIT